MGRGGQVRSSEKGGRSEKKCKRKEGDSSVRQPVRLVSDITEVVAGGLEKVMNIKENSMSGTETRRFPVGGWGEGRVGGGEGSMGDGTHGD